MTRLITHSSVTSPMPSNDPSSFDLHDPSDSEIKFQNLPSSRSDSLKPLSPSQIEIDLTISKSQTGNDRGNVTLPISVILLALVSIVTIMTAASWYSQIIQDQSEPRLSPGVPSTR